MLNMFNIPLRLVRQIKLNPLFGAGFFAFILLHVILISVVVHTFELTNLKSFLGDYVIFALTFLGFMVFSTSYLLACILDHFIIMYQNKRNYHSSCTAFISTIFFIYSLDNKINLSFKNSVLLFNINESLLSASDQHKFKEYQILSKILSSQYFCKALCDTEESLILQWQIQCNRFADSSGNLTAHWVKSTEELKNILLPHKTTILEIARNIEKYNENENGAEMILERIKDSFSQLEKK